MYVGRKVLELSVLMTCRIVKYIHRHFCNLEFLIISYYKCCDRRFKYSEIKLYLWSVSFGCSRIFY